MAARTMDVLVSYDVSTETRAGRRRLRRVAQVCLNYGQRVQLSVYECRLTRAQFEQMQADLLREIDEAEDQLRIYRIAQPRDAHVHVWGRDDRLDLDGPLIL
jgi:CRISPR-associated protein Cas2